MLRPNSTCIASEVVRGNVWALRAPVEYAHCGYIVSQGRVAKGRVNCKKVRIVIQETRVQIKEDDKTARRDGHACIQRATNVQPT